MNSEGALVNNSISSPKLLIIDALPVQRAIWEALTELPTLVARDYQDPVVTQATVRADIRVVIVDESLPDGNGFDRIPDLRSQFPHAIIIATSAHHHSQYEAYLKGAHLFFAKPYDWDSMNACINQALKAATGGNRPAMATKSKKSPVDQPSVKSSDHYRR